MLGVHLACINLLMHVCAVPAGQYDSDPSSYLYSLRPTWRLLPGTCFESLAFAVARDCGVPETTLAAAAADYFAILKGGSKRPGYNSIVRVANSSGAGQQSSRSSGTGSSSFSSIVDENVGSSLDSNVEGSEPPAGPPPAAGGDDVGQEGTGGSQQGFPSSRRAWLAQLLEGGASSAAEAAAARTAAGRVTAHKLFEQLKAAVLLPPAAKDAAGQEAPAGDPAAADAAAPDAAADADATAKQGIGRRRRKRVTSSESKKEQLQPPPQQPPQPQPQQQDMAAARGAEGGVGYGVVHEAVPGSVPPPAHEGQSIVYMVLDEQGFWYGGETQVRKGIN